MRAAILEMLRKHMGEYISGEEISKQLNISRTAVWKHIQTLKEQGYAIESHSRSGYILRQPPDRLLPEEVCPRLTTETFGCEMHYYTDVDSTNNIAKKLAAAGCPEGTIVVAEAQNTGRGRLSRGWFSPLGKGIWLSVVLRPTFSPQEAPKCTLMAATAIQRAISNCTGVRCGIKWPNDILFEGKKLVGVLTEMSAEMDAINYVVIGMGVNVNIEPESVPSELADIATSILMAAGRPVSRLDLLVELLKQLEDAYRIAQTDGFEPLLDRWRAASITLGQEVDVIGVTNRFSGKALNIDDDGALLVETQAGIKRVMAGDVSIRPTR